MSVFQFEAVNQKGLKEKGTLEADSLKEARQLLRHQGLIPILVKATRKSHTQSHKTFFKKNTMSSKELALMTRQLATLLAAGLPLEAVLNAVAEQTEKPQTQSLLLSVRSKVSQGHALASALRDFPNAFSELYCGTIAAGEKSGHLDIVLQRLADYTEQQFKMRQKIQHALIYPIIMILVSLSIVGFLLEYVVPKMVSVYSNIGQALPTMTLFLMSMSAYIKAYGIYFLIIIAISLYLFKRQLQKDILFRKKFHLFLLKIPLMGNTIKIANTARFARTFAILSSAGVAVLEAIQIASALITHLPIRDAIMAAAMRIREGAAIHLALKQTTFFPPMSIHLIASGEASGQLEPMLERAANNQEQDIHYLIETCLALFEPAIILVMGAVVLFIVLAILLPIFQLDQFAS